MFRYDIVNHFIKSRNFENYLEIGVFEAYCFRKIISKNKDGVDPGLESETPNEVNYKMDSNTFFEQLNESKKYDIVFIDGLHHSEQVDFDIQNSIINTVDNGVIVLHDCSPHSYNITTIPRQSVEWTGDVYKSVLKFQKDNDKHTFFTVNTDYGVGVIVKNTKPTIKYDNEFYENGIKDWDFFNQNREKLLNLISIDEFIKYVDNQKNN
jgi:hypothetical protein